MEYINDYNSLCKQRMVLILEHFIDFCNKNALRYYCCAGTALGTVRHKGFIPWDDDVDVMMPRPDYERFIKIYDNKANSTYELLTSLNNRNYYLPFAKLIDKNSTVVERKSIPCTLGLFIDIFPLDGMPNDTNEVANIAESYSLYRQHLSDVSSKEGFGGLIFMLLKGQFDRFRRALKFRFDRNRYRDEIVKKLMDFGKNYDYEDADMVSVEDISDIAHPFPKKWLEPYQIMRFEDIDVRMPQNTHNYLKNAYGDYMQLPPKEEQVSCHMDELCFFDISEHKEYDEIKYRILFGYYRNRIRRFLNRLLKK